MALKTILPADLTSEITTLGASDYLVAQPAGETALSKLKLSALTNAITPAAIGVTPAAIGAASLNGDPTQTFVAGQLEAGQYASPRSGSASDPFYFNGSWNGSYYNWSIIVYDYDLYFTCDHVKFRNRPNNAYVPVTASQYQFGNNGDNDKIYMYSNDIMGFYIDGANRAALTSASIFAPPYDNSGAIGSEYYSWGEVWALDTSINQSDERRKTEILDSDLGLGFIAALRPVSFKWKVAENIVTAAAQPGDDPIITPRAGVRRHYGLIAQEVKTVLGDKDFAGYVVGAETGVQCLRYSEFIAPLIKAVQDLAGQVRDLSARLEALESA